jgi:hypothetical protein
MRSAWLLLTGLLFGCDKLDAALPALSLQARPPQGEVAAREANSRDAERARDAQRRLGSDLAQLRQRLSLPALPAALPDCRGVASSIDSELPLATAYVDAREQTKHLIPRRVAERLESEDLSELRHAADQLEGRTPEELAALELAVEAWRKRRVLGVFYVSDYSGPALVLRVGELKRSWVAGHFGARFALYDTVEQRLLCAYTLHVQNDTKDAPIRSRLQSETRIKLERALAARLLELAQAELTRSASRLTLELAVAGIDPPNP